MVRVAPFFDSWCRYHVLDGGPDPQREDWAINFFFWGGGVAVHCKLMGHSTVSCAKTAEPIDVPFWMKTMVGPRNHVLYMGCRSPNWRRQFSAVVRAIQIRHSRRSAVAAAFAAKGMIQSPITSCSRRGHSVCQAIADRNPENSERRRCGLSTGKRVMGVHSAGEV